MVPGLPALPARLASSRNAEKKDGCGEHVCNVRAMLPPLLGLWCKKKRLRCEDGKKQRNDNSSNRPPITCTLLSCSARPPRPVPPRPAPPVHHPLAFLSYTCYLEPGGCVGGGAEVANAPFRTARNGEVQAVPAGRRRRRSRQLSGGGGRAGCVSFPPCRKLPLAVDELHAEP